jgi:hypothetical protein
VHALRLVVHDVVDEVEHPRRLVVLGAVGLQAIANALAARDHAAAGVQDRSPERVAERLHARRRRPIGPVVDRDRAAA